MLPLYDNIQVVPVEEKGVLNVIPDRYIVVKVVALPPESDANQFYWAVDKSISIGDEILCNYIVDYLIKGVKVYFVKTKDIVGVVDNVKPSVGMGSFTAACEQGDVNWQAAV